MPPVRDQAKVFGFFAFGLAGLMWLLTGGGSHAGCFALCCGMIPGLSAALLVPVLAAGAEAVRRAMPSLSRGAPEAPSSGARPGVYDDSTLTWCALSALVATVWLSVKLWPLVCCRLCNGGCPLNAGSVGVCGLIFGLQGVMAGLAMLHATPAPNRAVAANSQGLAAKDTAPGEPQPEGTARRSLRGVLFQGPVSAGGELVEAVLAVPPHASTLRLDRIFQFATRLPKPVGGPAWLKTERTAEHSATSTALYIGSVELEVSGP